MTSPVKRFPLLVLAALILALAGCESAPALPTRVRERISPTYRTRVFAAEQRATYEAAKSALGEFGFRFVSGGPAQGKLEALSAVEASDSMQRARQVSLSVKLSPAADGGTEVAALFSDIYEDDFSKRAGMGTTQALKDSPLYEVFFRYLEQSLTAARSAP
jgi:hypothetical protein